MFFLIDENYKNSRLKCFVCSHKFNLGDGGYLNKSDGKACCPRCDAKDLDAYAAINRARQLSNNRKRAKFHEIMKKQNLENQYTMVNDGIALVNKKYYYYILKSRVRIKKQKKYYQTKGVHDFIKRYIKKPKKRKQKPIKIDFDRDNTICPYCDKPASLLNGEMLYPHREDLWRKLFYVCNDCDARVGCYENTTKPTGRLANAKLRKAKTEAYKSLNKLCEIEGTCHKEVYEWLSKKLDISKQYCNISMFNIDLCRKIKRICEDRMCKIPVN